MIIIWVIAFFKSLLWDWRDSDWNDMGGFFSLGVIFYKMVAEFRWFFRTVDEQFFTLSEVAVNFGNYFVK